LSSRGKSSAWNLLNRSYSGAVGDGRRPGGLSDLLYPQGRSSRLPFVASGSEIDSGLTVEERLSRTLDWLYSLEARGEIYKLERMENALALIGSPHRKLRVVHIAGTKGKGSVAAMLDAVLRAAGMRVGLYTKPHLVNLAERTRIDGAEMPARRML